MVRPYPTHTYTSIHPTRSRVQATKAAVQTAADVFGIPAEVDNNGGIHESAAIVQRNFKGATIDTGMRMGTFMAYLRPAIAKQPNVSGGVCACVCGDVCIHAGTCMDGLVTTTTTTTTLFDAPNHLNEPTHPPPPQKNMCRTSWRWPRAPRCSRS